MKLFKIMVLVLFLFIPKFAHSGTFEGAVSSSIAQGYNSANTIDLRGMKKMSMQVVYSTHSFTVSTVDSGTRSTDSINVTNWDALQGRVSSMTITLTNGKNSASILSKLIISWQRAVLSPRCVSEIIKVSILIFSCILLVFFFIIT